MHDPGDYSAAELGRGLHRTSVYRYLDHEGN